MSVTWGWLSKSIPIHGINMHAHTHTHTQQGWMGQYFERMQLLSDNKDLPPRIRFMLMDVIDLRRNNVSSGGS